MATGFQYQKSNEPKQPQKYKIEPTLQTWEEFCGMSPAGDAAQSLATDEELNEILYGDADFAE